MGVALKKPLDIFNKLIVYNNNFLTIIVPDFRRFA